MDTNQLIHSLAAQSGPVQRLAPPWKRTVVWAALAIPYIALVIVFMSPRADLLAKASDARFIVEMLAALATGISAAAAAFASTIPAVNRKYLLLPALPMAVWLGTLGQGCVQAWMKYGPEGLSLQPDWFCFPAIVVVGAVPAATMAVMLRRGAPLSPHATAALGGLAAAGLGNFGLRFFHPQDASLMVLVWQVGSVIVLSALAGWAGRQLLNWRSITRPPGLGPRGA